MIFYFYAMKNNVEYTVHPELLMYDKFVGWTDNDHEVIVGKVKHQLCKVSHDELKQRLSTKFNINDYTPTADAYYILEIENIKFENRSIYNERMNCISENLINPKFHEHAPRII